MVELVRQDKPEEEEKIVDLSQTGSIQSDAWPKTMQPKLKSRAHAILLSIIGQGKFTDKNIEYKAMSVEDQA